MKAIDTAPIARTLLDLPEHRRWQVAYRHALHESFPDLDFDAPFVCGPSCGAIPAGPFPMNSYRGADGFYHLIGDAEKRGPRTSCGQEWATTIRHPKAFAKPFTLTLESDAVEPWNVPPERQCPEMKAHWAGFVEGQGKIAPIRRALTEEFGYACLACGGLPGKIVDHDHLTGLVRGYLCLQCNDWADRCLHLSDCLLAEYMNDPPAVRLKIFHPAQAKTIRRPNARDLERMESAGYAVPDAHLALRTDELELPPDGLFDL